jgi:hypothetical protein
LVFFHEKFKLWKVWWISSIYANSRIPLLQQNLKIFLAREIEDHHLLINQKITNKNM